MQYSSLFLCGFGANLKSVRAVVWVLRFWLAFRIQKYTELYNFHIQESDTAYGIISRLTFKLGRKFAKLLWTIPPAWTIYAFFAAILVKITAYTCPRKENVFYYKTSFGAPQKITSEISVRNINCKAESNLKWDINLCALNVGT